MNRSFRPLLVLGILILLAMACNLPTMGATNGDATPLPAPNQTLTALFAITPQTTPTFTFPAVMTATNAGSQPSATSQPPVIASPTNAPLASNTPLVVNTLPASNTLPAATIPGMRPRSPVTAKYLNTPPTLDGDWGEWKDITTEYPATNVVYGKQNWTDGDDLAGSFHVGWDNNYLYVAVKVRDDKYVQNASGDNIFKGDCIEILLDAKLSEDFYYDKLSADDFQLGLSPGRPDVNGTREAYLWFPASVAGSKSGVTIASRAEAGVYRVEAAIPWSLFEVTPANGLHLGFALSVSDNDNPGENVQQSMVSNVAGRMLTDPTTWGDLLLSK